jgi:uncharacterized membrane protein
MKRQDGLLPELRNALGSRVAPPRFVMFIGLMAATILTWHKALGAPWGDAVVMGFDLAALAFAVSLLPLARDHGAQDMRRHSAGNDANRGWVLAITVLTTLTILAAITGELPAAKQGDWFAITKLVGTLALSWAFTNLIFMLHYAHMHYAPGADRTADRGGFEFPGTAEPNYWDFLYFSFTAGMSFAASDVNVTSREVRKILIVQCLLSFLFNIGVLAFSINVLAGAAG